MGYRGKCYPQLRGTWGVGYWEHRGGAAAFLLRHKGVYDHWISLWREQGQPWKWANGTKFNHLFQIRGGGDCAYLNDEKGVSSSQCYMGRRWICRKLEVYVMGKETALEGGSKWDS
ncbi:unnamed protein product [Lepidochelys olivacea]